MALKQEASVADYREKFEMIAVTLSGVLDKALFGAYMNGLKEEV